MYVLLYLVLYDLNEIDNEIMQLNRLYKYYLYNEVIRRIDWYYSFQNKFYVYVKIDIEIVVNKYI